MTGRLVRSAAALLWALLPLLALTLVAPPASAHTELDNTVPVDGATLTQTPGSLQLNFTEPVNADLASLVVRAPDGRDLTAGPARQSGPGLIQPLTPSPQAGTIQVSYRVVSLDGHPVTGTFSFEVLRGDADPASVGPDSGAAGGSGDAGSDVSLAGPLLGAAVVLLLVAVGAVLARRRGEGREGVADPRPQTIPPPAR